jgi:hypothetical protein
MKTATVTAAITVKYAVNSVMKDLFLRITRHTQRISTAVDRLDNQGIFRIILKFLPYYV